MSPQPRPVPVPDVAADERAHDHDHDHDLGLAYDLPTVLNRRRLLGLFGGGIGLAALAACGASDGRTSGAPSSTDSTGTTKIPQETAGPFPGDGSNGPDVLTASGIVRRDIRASFGSSTTVAKGVPLTIVLKVLDTKKLSASGGAAALAGAAVYLWHCNIDGKYSMYSQGVTHENYLRGVQEADSDGRLTFTSIFPAAYDGRWPHLHFEVYPSLSAATGAGSRLRTSQLALPEDICRQVHATEGYSQSVSNLSRTSLARDNVFRDGWSLQTPTMTGSIADGLTANLSVPV
ncbi:MAG: Protocatechuate dioxygenase [Frankiales bacterium]|nr:Protocatechuate dioxygenase [Frankiales bacterium]